MPTTAEGYSFRESACKISVKLLQAEMCEGSVQVWRSRKARRTELLHYYQCHACSTRQVLRALSEHNLSKYDSFVWEGSC
jgi:hypothetical protein